MGYLISFPILIGDNCKLYYKEIGISIKKSVDYNMVDKLKEIMSKAINDHFQYDSLKDYNPYFSTAKDPNTFP